MRSTAGTFFSRSGANVVVALFQLTRPHTCAAGALATILGAYLGGGPERTVGRAVLAVLAIVFLISASNSLNDAIDSSTDEIFKPLRPVPSGRISRADAILFATICGLLALVISGLLGFACLVLAVAISAIAWLYSIVLKGIPLLGNVVVGATAATPVIFGGLAVGGIGTRTLIVALGVAIYQIAFEIIKTLRDIEEDSAAGLTTLGIQAPRMAGAIGVILVATVVAAVTAAEIVRSRTLLSVLVAAGVVVLNAVSALLLAHSRSRDSVRLCLRLMRLSWVPGLVLLFLLAR